MEVKIESPEKGKKEVLAKVDIDTMTPKFETAYREYKKKIVLGGFRRGKVPVPLIKQMFGKKIHQEVAEKHLPDYVQEIIAKHKIKAISQPELKDMSFDEKYGLSFKFEVEVEPEIEVTKYKDFEFEKITYEVDEIIVDNTLESIRNDNATMDPVEGAAEEGHTLQVDLQAVDQTGVPLVGQKYENSSFHIDSKDESNYAVSQQFLGAEVGETRRIVIVKPASVLSQKPEEEYFEATVKEIKVKVLPDLDDEFAKDNSELETFADYRILIKEKLELQLKRDNFQRFTQLVIGELVKSNLFDVPEKMVDFRMDIMINNWKKQLSGKHFDEQAFQNKYRPNIINDIKWMLIQDKIVELEKITQTDDDFEEFYQEVAEYEGTEIERVRNRYLDTKARKQIEPKVVEKKVIDFVIAQSKVVEKISPYSELLNKETLVNE